MAGHSKWANIKHRKAAQDARRGKLFTRMIREITVAAAGGADPADNPRLRSAVEKARLGNMSRDVIERAIRRGSGTGEEARLIEQRYEGYAPSGVAVLVDTVSDNRNRTVAQVRHIFNKFGGNLGTDGSVSWMFTRQGEIVFAADSNEDELMTAAIAAGIDDIAQSDDGCYRLLTDQNGFDAALKACKEAGLAPLSAEMDMTAANSIVLSGTEAEKVINLLNALENLDETQEVYSNAEFVDA